MPLLRSSNILNNVYYYKHISSTRLNYAFNQILITNISLTILYCLGRHDGAVFPIFDNGGMFLAREYNYKIFPSPAGMVCL
jgi:hypothetical protein